MREIEISIGEISFKATLLEDKAPKGSEALWKALPIKAEAHHGGLAGTEIYFNLMKPYAKLEQENPYLLSELKPGDLSTMGGGFAIFYGEVGPEPYPENVVARVEKEEELLKLKKAGYRVWYQPGDRILIKKVE